jgi:hypothetical protein
MIDALRPWGLRLTLLCCGPVFLPACDAPAGNEVETDALRAPDPGLEQALVSARAAGDALTTELRDVLTAELAAGGPERAVRVCSEAAPAIAQRHSVDGVTVRRVTSRTRNPDSAPDEAEVAGLKLLQERHGTGELPAELFEVVPAGGGRELRYLRPILVAEPCLACHGDRAALDPAVRALLREHYPHDTAVGYRAGDLRGAVSVRVPLADAGG